MPNLSSNCIVSAHYHSPLPLALVNPVRVRALSALSRQFSLTARRPKILRTIRNWAGPPGYTAYVLDAWTPRWTYATAHFPAYTRFHSGKWPSNRASGHCRPIRIALIRYFLSKGLSFPL